MKNLLAETEYELQHNSKSWEDVEFIGTSGGDLVIAIEDFKKVADKDYDNGYGGNVVNGDLVIVFKDGTFLQRGEYDGSEWWDFVAVPKLADNAGVLTSIFNV